MRDRLVDIFERIAANQHSEADVGVLRQALLAGEMQSVLQSGRYNINIGNVSAGEPIQIGDRTYVSINDEAIEAIVAAIQKGVRPKPEQVDFGNYLRSILDDEDYREWQEIYTPTTVEGKKQSSQPKFSRRLKLRTETVKPPQNQKESGEAGQSNQQEQVEQWDVLAGLRNYAPEHVLLIGKPGSGKTSSLEYLLWEEANNALKHSDAKIPVLVRLRRCTSSIEALIQDFLIRHQCPLEIEAINYLIQQGKFLLLLDGLNELPEKFAVEAASFRDKCRNTTPMVVSTRDLSVGGTLDIKKTLKMLPLTEPQMQEFVQGYLGEKGKQLFQQLKGDQLRKFAETPLLLWMLCRVFVNNSQVPANLGLAFREFTQLYDNAIQEDAPADAKDQWPKLLRHLAFALMHDQKPTDFRLSMPREEVENLLTEYLQKAGRTNTREYAEKWLKELLDYHLIQSVIQPNFEEHIEFRHQMIQEYYAAEALRRRLPGLSDAVLKREYLNYLKWTEPIALMLALVEDEAQALRVVKLAMDEVDLMLGARLAGEVWLAFQSESICMIVQKDLPIWLKIILLGETQSPKAVEELAEFLVKPEAAIRQKVIWALRQLEEDLAVPIISTALQDTDENVREVAVRVLGEFTIEVVVPYIVQAIKKEKSAFVKTNAIIHVLSKSNSETAIVELLSLMQDPDYSTRTMAEDGIKKIDQESIKPILIKSIKDKETEHLIKRSAIFILGEIGDESSKSSLFEAKLDLDENIYLDACDAIAKINLRIVDRTHLEVAKQRNKQNHEIKKWLSLVKSEAPVSRGNAILYLANLLNQEEAIELVNKALSDPHYYVRSHAISSLIKLKGEAAIPEAIQALRDPHYKVKYQASQILWEFRERKETFSKNMSLFFNEVVICLVDILNQTQNVDEQRKTVDTIVNLLDISLDQFHQRKIEDAFIYISYSADNLLRHKAAKGLSFFPNTRTMNRLLEILTDSDSFVLLSASEEIKRIHHDFTKTYLPILTQIAHSSGNSSILSVLTSIQNRCKFYNYEIAHHLIPPGKPISLYIAAHPTDESLQTHLTHHLTPLDRQNLITLWSKCHILPGDEPAQAIHRHLHTADIILLLISPNALADDTTYHHEILPALQRHQAGQVHLLPILLRPTDYAATLLSQLPHLPKNSKAIATWNHPNAAFQEIAETVREIALKLRSEIKHHSS